jgi:hypothetical protein
MNKELIIEMAKQSDIGFLFNENWLMHEEIESFAKLVAAHERETCAQICDVLAVHPEYASDITKLAAQAIRNRK